MSTSRASLTRHAAIAALFSAPLLFSLSALGQATTNPAAAKPTAPAASPTPTPTPAPNSVSLRKGWWNETNFYQVFLRSFADSTQGPLRNDGIGDIRGLIEHLDYLKNLDPMNPKDLAIGGLWLMPIHPSPSYHGYDVTDYKDINKQFGNLDDFRELLAECKKRNIKVIIDFVPNHCSNQHPWFQNALDPKSPTHDWFIWADKDPAWKGPWGQKVWHPIAMANVDGKGAKAPKPADAASLPPAPPAGPFYYGLFSHTMPDLNYTNPAVTKEILDVVKFWLTDVKIDGLRIDAIRHLIEDGQVQENTPATHAWLKNFFVEYKKMNPDALTVGEVWAPSEQAASYVGDQLDLVFEFDLAEAIITAANTARAEPLLKQLDRVQLLYPPNQFATFLANHDQTRVATRLGNDPAKLRLAAQILYTIPGVPFIYYGEEIGMVGDKPDENLRTPMQWSDDSVAGFSLSDAWQPPNKNYTTLNVRAQDNEPSSLLSLYRKLANIRANSPALAFGDYRPVLTGRPDVVAFIRHATGVDRLQRDGLKKQPASQSALVIINLSNKSIDDYSLTATNLPFREILSTTELLRNGLTTLPKIDNQGAFKDYRPIRVLRPSAAYIIDIESR